MTVFANQFLKKQALLLFIGLVAAVGLAVVSFRPIFAAPTLACTWQGGTDDWDVAANWSCGVVPDGDDDVTVVNGIVTLDSDTTINSLTMTGGTLTGSGNLSITTDFTFSSGTHRGSGTTTVNGDLIMSGINSRQLNDTRRVVLTNGTASLSNNSFWLYDATILHIQPGATLDVRSNSSIGWQGTIINDGAIRKSADTDTNIFYGQLISNGDFEVLTGTLQINAASTVSGTATIASDATLRLNGNQTFAASSQITGDGTLWVSSGSIAIDGTFTPANLQQSSGTVNLNSNGSVNNMTQTGGTWSGIGNVTIANDFTFTGGNQRGSGTTTVGGDLIMGGVNSRQLNDSRRVVVTSGMATLSGTGSFWIYDSATLHIDTDATLDLQGNGSLGWVGSIINDGIVRKSADTNTSILYGQLTSAGGFDVMTGTIQINASGPVSGTATVAQNATLRINGSLDFAPASQISSNGEVWVSGGTSSVQGPFATNSFRASGGNITFDNTFAATTIDQSGGTVTLNTNSATNSMTQSGGTWQGSGNLTIANDMVFDGGTQRGTGTTTVNGNMTMSGTASRALRDSRQLRLPDGTATMSGSGSFWLYETSLLHIGATSLFDWQSNGSLGWVASIVNDGVIRKSADANTSILYGQVISNGDFEVMTGTLQINASGTISGAATISPSATLRLNSNLTFPATSQISGAGRVWFNSGIVTVQGAYSPAQTDVTASTVNFDTTGSTDTMNQTGGAWQGSGDLTISNDLTFNGGSQRGTGTTTIQGNLIMTGSASRELRQSRRMELSSGTATLDGTGSFWVYEQAIFVNAATSQFDWPGSGGLNWTGTFLNEGTLMKGVGSADSTLYGTVIGTGAIDIMTSTLNVNAGGSYSGTVTVDADATLQITNNWVLNSASMVSGGGDVHFSGGVHAVEGNYAIQGTTRKTSGTTTFDNAPNPSTVNFIQSAGIFNADTDFTILGDFTFSNGTFNSGSGSLIFPQTNRGGGQLNTLTAERALALNDLTISAGVVLQEVSNGDDVTVGGNLTNNGTIRTTQSVIAGGQINFGLTGVAMDFVVTNTLQTVTVDRIDSDHPNASPDEQTGVYWQIAGDGTGFTYAMTLPANQPTATTAVCYYVDSILDWDCNASSFDASVGSVTRNGLTTFSDWTVGERDTTAVRLRGQSSVISHQWSVISIVMMSLLGLTWRLRPKRTP